MDSNFTSFLKIEGEIHLLLLLLEKIMKLNQSTASGEAEAKNLAGLKLEYKQTLAKVFEKLKTIPEPGRVIDFCRHLSLSNQMSVSQESRGRLFKKLEIDFSVLLKRLESLPKAKVKPVIQDDSSENLPDTEVFSKQKILDMVRTNRGSFLNQVEQRKHAKKVLASLVKAIRANDPQKISDNIDSYVKKNPVKIAKRFSAIHNKNRPVKPSN